MKYEKKEIESLEFYTSRKSHRCFDYEEINEFLRFLLNPNDFYKWVYIDYTKIKEILNSVEKLYCLCCKYGKHHDIPRIIYRQEHHYNDIIKHTDKNLNRWSSESFLSFTKTLSEIDRFKFDENAKVITASVNNSDIKNRKIPFIDVTDILGEDKYLKDEQEILIPPFTLMEISYLNMKVLSDSYIKLQNDSLEEYEELLEKFILYFKDYGNNLEQLNYSRKKLGELFSKKLLKEKSRIMMI